MTRNDDTPRQAATSTSLQREYRRLADGYEARWRHYTNDVAQRLRAHGLASDAPGLLDVGCGTGAMLTRFGAAGAIGIDPSQAMLRRMHARCGACARGEALPFADACFDTVLSTSALHYADDPARILAECRRVLPRDGRLLLIDWCADAWSTRLAVAALRLARRPLGRILGLRHACNLIASAGFDVIAAERFRAHPAWGMFIVDARAV